MRVRFTSPKTVGGVHGKHGNRDHLPHLEAHLEVIGYLSQIMTKLVSGGRSVEGRVVPNGPEQGLPLIQVLAVLAKTFSGECALGALLLVDLALPAFVGPGRGAETD